MATTHPHRLVIGCRRDVTISGVTNTERMRRLGIAAYKSSSLAQALQYINGSLAYNANDPEALNFQAVWRTGAGVEFLIGAHSLTDYQWEVIEDRILNNQNHLGGATLRYARLFDIEAADGHFRLTNDYNVPALEPYVNTIVTEVQLLGLAGLNP
jgi:hypothetical protein